MKFYNFAAQLKNNKQKQQNLCNMDSRLVRNRKDVENFLRQFLPKMDVLGIFFLNRDKNQEALKMLGITPSTRKEIIRNITVDDYIETIIDEFSYGDMWVFGKDCDGVGVYVKIALGAPNTNTICISFHKAEYPLNYAFK